MIQAGVVARLALRELWISYRLLLAVIAFVGAAATVALIPAAAHDVAQRLAIGLAVATVLSGAIGGWSMGEERRSGRAGWLVTRALSRGTLLAGWFIALLGVAWPALAAAAILGWLALAGVTLRLEPAGYVAIIAAIGAGTAAAIALGLLLGVVAAPRVAVLGVAFVCAAAVLAALALPADASLVPWGAHALLADLREPGGSPGPGLRAAGVGLALTAVLLAGARVALERVEL